MSDAGMRDAGVRGSEGLFRRWSRRKLETRGAPPVERMPAPPVAPSVPPEPAPVLPDLDTLDAGSDYTAFLQQGVPAAVQQLALRRAWTSDAAIAGFRGMADYDWDFNAPNYGALWPTDDVAKLIQAVIAPPAPEPGMAPAEAPPVVVQAPAPLMLEAATVAADGQADAGQPDQEAAAVPAAPRRHGSALPC